MVTAAEWDWARRILGIPELYSYSSESTFFGQKQIVAQVEPFLKRVEKFPNTLILGPPGIGKTHLARWIANQRKYSFEELLCPVGPEELPISGIVLLDEIHRQTRPEWLFPVMENVTVTILGATTRPDKIEPAFSSRFFLRLHLERYDQESMEEMVRHYSSIEDDEWVAIYATASAGNPRQLLRLVKTAQGLGTYEPEQVLPACRINADGLTELHLKYLQTLYKMNRPIGLSQIATLLYVDEGTVRDLERLLIDMELASLASNGRALTKMGKKYVELLQGQ